MRVLAHLALGASTVASLSTATKVKSDSINGVITLLQGLLKNSEKESKGLAEIYDKTACSCRDNQRDMVRQFEETQKEIDRQTGISKDAKAKSNLLQIRLDKHLAPKAEMEQQVADKFNDLKKNAGSAEKTVNFQEETDAALEEEVSEIGTINQPYLTGLIEVDTQTLSAERAKCNERLRKAEEMMAACDKVLKVLEGAQSASIVKMVKTLRQHAFDRKTAIQQGENECQSKIYDLEKSISSNSNFLELSKKSSERLTGEKADVDSVLAKANEEIAKKTGFRDELKDSIKKTDKECRAAAKDFDEHNALLSAEIGGLNGAISALKKVPGNDAPSFVQLAATVSGSVISRIDSAITGLAQKATSMHSNRLATMALQLRLGNKATGPDFFASVRSMIVTMVERLEDEQMAETSKTDWCASSLAELKNTKKESQVAYEEAQSAVRASEAVIAEKRSERNEKMAEKKEAVQVRKEMGELAQSKHKMYTEQEAEKSGGEAALKEAIGFLEKVYAGEGADARASGPSAGTKTRATNGGGIITMLVGIMEDYAWDADVANMEMKCWSYDSYAPRDGSDKVSCDDGVARTGAPTDPPTPVRASELIELRRNMFLKGKEIVELSDQIKDLSSEIKEEKVTLAGGKKSKDEKNGLLESAITAMKARQEACVNAEDSFEARQKRREEEVAALKEALEILESHSKNSEMGAGASFLATRKRAV